MLSVGGSAARPSHALAALPAEQVRDHDQQKGLRKHHSCPGFEARAKHNQLRAVAHQFTQLTSRLWGDPRLRQPLHPQQFRQIAGVTDVVLDTPYRNPLTPNGCARWTVAPAACRASTAQYQPYVASTTTSGRHGLPQLQRQRSGSLRIHTADNRSPVLVFPRSPNGAGADRSQRTVFRDFRSQGASYISWI